MDPPMSLEKDRSPLKDNEKDLILTNWKRRGTSFVEPLAGEVLLGVNYCLERVCGLRMFTKNALSEVGHCWAMRCDKPAGEGI